MTTINDLLSCFSYDKKSVVGTCDSIIPLPNESRPYFYLLNMSTSNGPEQLFYFGVIPESQYSALEKNNLSFTQKFHPFPFNKIYQKISSSNFKDKINLSKRDFDLQKSFADYFLKQLNEDNSL